jgi:hypothetical protein
MAVEQAVSGRSSRRRPIDAKARWMNRMAAAIERNPQVVEACVDGVLALEKLCRFYGVAPGTLDKKRVDGTMAVDACSARIVILVN